MVCTMTVSIAFIFAFLAIVLAFVDDVLCCLCFATFAIGVVTAQLVYGTAILPWTLPWTAVAAIAAVSIVCGWSVFLGFPRKYFSFSVLRFSFSVGVVAAVFFALSRYGYFDHTISSLCAGCLATALAQAPSALVLHIVLRKPWKQVISVKPDSSAHRLLVVRRYAHLLPNIRLWAIIKLRLDPMFRSLSQYVSDHDHLIDIGCGYGLASVWLAHLYPNLQITAFDPASKRVAIARYALGTRATVFEASATDFDRALLQPTSEHTQSARKYDVALCADVIHHLPDPTKMLNLVASHLTPGGLLLLRTTIRIGIEDRSHKIERAMVRARHQTTFGFYTEEEVRKMLTNTGFEVVRVDSTVGKTETLFIARTLSITDKTVRDVTISYAVLEAEAAGR